MDEHLFGHGGEAERHRARGRGRPLRRAASKFEQGSGAGPRNSPLEMEPLPDIHACAPPTAISSKPRDSEAQAELEAEIAALKGTMNDSCDLSLPKPALSVPVMPLQAAGSLTADTVMRRPPSTSPKP